MRIHVGGKGVPLRVARQVEALGTDAAVRSFDHPFFCQSAVVGAVEAHHRAPRVEPPVGLTERKRVVVAVRLPAQRGVRGVVEVQVLSNPDLRAYLDRTIDFAITPVQKLPYSKAGFR